MLAYKEVFCSCNFIQIYNLLRVMYSSLKMLSRWRGSNFCGVTQMQISQLNSTSWQHRVVGHPTSSRRIYTKSLYHIYLSVVRISALKVFKTAFEYNFFPLFMFYGSPHICYLTHGAENFCTQYWAITICTEESKWWRSGLIWDQPYRYGLVLWPLLIRHTWLQFHVQASRSHSSEPILL